MPWLIRADKRYVARADPATLAKQLGVTYDELTGPDSNAVSNVHAIWEPDLSAVDGFPNKYWIVNAFPDDTVTLMDQAARDAVDAAETTARLDAVANEVDNVEDILRAVLKLLVDEFNRHADRLNGIKDGIAAANNLAEVKAAMAAVPTMPIRTFQDLKDAVRAALGS